MFPWKPANCRGPVKLSNTSLSLKAATRTRSRSTWILFSTLPIASLWVVPIHNTPPVATNNIIVVSISYTTTTTLLILLLVSMSIARRTFSSLVSIKNTSAIFSNSESLRPKQPVGPSKSMWADSSGSSQSNPGQWWWCSRECVCVGGGVGWWW